MALRQHRETVIVPAARGTIVDRNGEPLALGRLATTVYANPRQVDDARDLTLAAAKQLDLDPAALYPTLVDRSRVRLCRAEGRPTKGEEPRGIRLRGPRLLPGGAPLLPAGACRCAGSRIRGSRQQGPRGARALARRNAGRQAREPDDRQGPVRPRARRRRDETRDPGEERPPHDRPQIQSNAEEVLQETVRRWGARAATAVVMDPHTGAILAMATAPRSTPTASRRREPTAGATAPSRTRTSRGRPSSS